MILSGGRVLEQMIKQVAHIIQPKARGYFGIDAKAYGVEGHVDLSALKVLCVLYVFIQQ
jgi:hypothetical protein